jgi:hypothetical protein
MTPGVAVHRGCQSVVHPQNIIGRQAATILNIIPSSAAGFHRRLVVKPTVFAFNLPTVPFESDIVYQQFRSKVTSFNTMFL